MTSTPTTKSEGSYINSKSSSIAYNLKLNGTCIELISGSIAGTLSKLIEHPFDTLKVRVQTHPQLYPSVLSCLKSTLQTSGLSSLFSGLPSPLIVASLENGILFLSYKSIVSKLTYGDKSKERDLAVVSAAGGLAGLLVANVLTPFELIKCKVQTLPLPKKELSNNGAKVVRFPTLNTLKSVLREGSLASFYKGHTTTLLREGLGGVVYFSTYELLLQKLNKIYSTDTLTGWKVILAGAAAGMSYNFCLFPVDIIKSNVQVSNQRKANYWDTVKRIYYNNQQSGKLRNFYRGCGVTMIRSIPSNATIFLTYEYVSAYLKTL